MRNRWKDILNEKGEKGNSKNSECYVNTKYKTTFHKKIVFFVMIQNSKYISLIFLFFYVIV